MAYSDEELIRLAQLPDDDDETVSKKAADKPEKDDKKAEATDESTDDDKTSTDDDKADKSDESDKSKDDDGKSDDKKDAKADDKTDDKKPTDEDEAKSRKEKRAERQKAFIESIKTKKSEAPKDGKSSKTDEIKPYAPLDYSKQDTIDEAALQKDREDYAAWKAAQAKAEASSEATKKADTDRFWEGVSYQSKALVAKPEYTFLDEKSPDFDPDKAAVVNELYLQLIGFDKDNRSVMRTDVKYDDFVENLIGTFRNWSDEAQAESAKNLASQAAKTGIRPAGAAKKSGKTFTPGDIAKMSAKELEDNEAEIDRQILSAFAK